MRDTYRRADSASKLLKVADYKEVAGEELRRALTMADKTPANRSAFLRWMATIDRPPLQRELVGLFRWVLKLRPTASSEQLRCGMECLSFCARFEVPKMYSAGWSLLVPVFNEVMVAQLANFKKFQDDGLAFLDFHEIECKLLLPWAQAMQAKRERQSWHMVGQALNALVSSGSLPGCSGSACRRRWRRRCSS